jgi:UDPglucose 6-dehydrogenase
MTIMRVTVMDGGTMGIVIGASLAAAGHDVTIVDVDNCWMTERDGTSDGDEPGLASLVREGEAAGRLRRVRDPADAIARSSVVVLAADGVGRHGERRNATHALAAADVVAREARRELVLVISAPVPVGTSARVAERVDAAARVPVHVCCNPVLLEPGTALDDFRHPDRVVLGVEHDQARSVMTELYAPFLCGGHPPLFMNLASAEVAHHAAMALRARRAASLLEFAPLCERVGASVERVRRVLIADRRVGAAAHEPAALGHPRTSRSVPQTAR